MKALPYFTQMMTFSPNTSLWTKRCHFTWILHDNLRAREREEKSNHKFLALDLVSSLEAVDILVLMYVAKIVILENVEVVKRSGRRNCRKWSTGMLEPYYCPLLFRGYLMSFYGTGNACATESVICWYAGQMTGFILLDL